VKQEKTPIKTDGDGGGAMNVFKRRMNRARYGLGAFLFLVAMSAGSAQAAGLQQITVPADARGPKILATVWTPCAKPPSDIAIEGPFVVPGTANCPVQGEKLPLVVISHGLAGAALSHHDTAETLADSGFVVVALNHSYDSGLDMKRADEIAAFLIRPTDIKRVLDYMVKTSPLAAKIDASRIGLFGFSRGGYTGLVLAGAEPDFSHPLFDCPDTIQLCAQMHKGQVAAPASAADPRIKAFVIADPLSFFPGKASLKHVKAPLQLWSSEKGGQGVEAKFVAQIARDLPVKPDYHRVPNSTHLSFLMPCTAALRKVTPPMICADPPGFDRAAFHKTFDAQVLAFFRQHLGG
jgi:predicted dienelactone hydrolase